MHWGSPEPVIKRQPICLLCSSSNSLQPCGLWPARLLSPWDFPGKNAGVGCHFLLQKVLLPNPGFKPMSPALAAVFFTIEPPGKPIYLLQIRSVAQSCPTPCDPMNRSTPGLPVHHQLLEFTETHVHRVSDAIQPS